MTVIHNASTYIATAADNNGYGGELRQRRSSTDATPFMGSKSQAPRMKSSAVDTDDYDNGKNKSQKTTASTSTAEEYSGTKAVTAEHVAFHYYVYRLFFMNGYLFHEGDDWNHPYCMVSVMACMLLYTYYDHLPSFLDFVFLAFLGLELYNYYQIFPSLANHSNLQVVMSLVLLPDHIQRCFQHLQRWFHQGQESRPQLYGRFLKWWKPATTSKILQDNKNHNNGHSQVLNANSATGAADSNQDKTTASSSWTYTSITSETVSALQWNIVILYFFAGFHKLNSDFFDVEVTCAFNIFDRILEPLGIECADFPYWMQAAFPPIVILMEGIPALLFLSPKWQKWGILLLLLVHGPLSFVGFADFSSIGMSNLFLFVSPTAAAVHMLPDKRYFTAAMTLAFVISQMFFGIELFEDEDADQMARSGLVLSLFFTPMWIRYFVANIPGPNVSFPKLWRNRIVPAIFVFFCMNNYLGLRTAGTVTMFSNLRTEGNFSNHFLLGSNPLKIFSYQEDQVFIRRADPRVSERYRYQMRDDVIVPYIQFARIVENAVYDEIPSLFLRVEYEGVIYETDDLAYDTNFTDNFEIPWWQRFFFEFREIYEPDEKQECMW